VLVLTQTAGAVGTITLNQPAKRNALSRALVEEMITAIADFQKSGVRVVVIRAATDAKVWSAGHDIDELPKGQDPLQYADPLERLLRAIASFPGPVIAMRPRPPGASSTILCRQQSWSRSPTSWPAS
jgi:methylmalonyl-CoA decarboxylase